MDEQTVLKIKFIGIDEWSRPIFKPVDKSKNYYLSDVNHLFPENASIDEIKEFYKDVSDNRLKEFITYHGREIDTDPMGAELKYNLEIV